MIYCTHSKTRPSLHAVVYKYYMYEDQKTIAEQLIYANSTSLCITRMLQLLF